MSISAGQTYTSSFGFHRGDFKELDAMYYIDIDNILTRDFYANVYGRRNITKEWEVRYIPEIINDIFIREIGLPPTSEGSYVSEDIKNKIEGPVGDGYQGVLKYAFTVNDKINSKKLIENLCATSPYIPRFNSLGQLSLATIPSDGGSVDHNIRPSEVFSFKFSQTDINDVYSGVKLRYYWDYGNKKFNKEIEEINVSDFGISPQVNNKILEVDEKICKYIRDETTAKFVANWLCLWNAQQHLKISLSLPVKHLNIEIGDICFISGLLGNKTAFGKAYNLEYTNKGQSIFNRFLVTSIKRSLDSIDIEVIQLHDLSKAFSNLVQNETYEVSTWDSPVIFKYASPIDGQIYFNYARAVDNMSFDQFLENVPTAIWVYHMTLGQNGTLYLGSTPAMYNNGTWFNTFNFQKDELYGISLSEITNNIQTELFYNLAEYNGQNGNQVPIV